MLCWFLPYNNANQPYIYIYIPCLLGLHPTSISHPSRSSENTTLGPHAIQKVPTSYFTHGSVYISMLLSQIILPPPPFTVSTKSVFCICISIPALKMGSSVPFSRFRVCVCVLSQFSCIWLFVTLWAAAHDSFLSMGILHARIPEWVASPFSKGSSQPGNQNHISYISCITGRFFTTSATWEGP